ncbi:MAG: porin, partial [Alphaproteobacteria bacterium]
MKKGLLTSIVLCASLLGGTAGAQEAVPTPTIGGNMDLTIDGTVRFTVQGADQDEQVDGKGRGYDFQSDESEVRFNARGTSDRGFRYGLSIEVQTQTDDVLNADETWIFIAHDRFGRTEFGDQDGAADRMFVAAEDVLQGRGGFDGPTDVFFDFGDALAAPSIEETDDATKAIYFTPRFKGFQGGFSWTPDTGHNGAQGGGADPVDNDGSFEKVVSLGGNFQETFNDVSVILSAVGEFGSSEPNPPNNDEGEDLEIWGVGTIVSFAGYSVGAGFAD